MSCFTDEADNVVSFNTNGEKFIKAKAEDLTPTGMYIIVSVPEGAKWLYATMANEDVSKSDAVIGTKSDKIVDLEPEWLRYDEHLMSIGPAAYIDDHVECKNYNRSKGYYGIISFSLDMNYGFDFVNNSGFDNFDCTMWFHLVRLSILTGNRRLAKPQILGYKFHNKTIPVDGYFDDISGINYTIIGIQGTLVNYYEGFKEPIIPSFSVRTRPKYVRWGKYCLPLFAGTDSSQQTNVYFGAEVGYGNHKAWISVMGHYYTYTKTIFTYGSAIEDNQIYPCINLSKVRSVTRVDYDKF